MTKKEFLMGLKVFWSCGGSNPDEDTLEVWYEMLKAIHLEDYEKAIRGITGQIDKPLATINFVGEIKDLARGFRRSREAVEAREAFKLPPKDLIKPKELHKLVKEFNAGLKEMPKEG